MWFWPREQAPTVETVAPQLKPVEHAAFGHPFIDPLASLQKTTADTSYQQLLERDQFCEAAKISINSTDNKLQFLRSLGMEMDSRYRELSEANSPYFSDPSRQNYTSRPARLIQALRLGGLLVIGNENHALDINRAWQLLKDLQREDPRNAAFGLFALVLEHDLQKSPEELHASALSLLSADHMDSLYTGFAREIFTRMQDNATKFTAGLSFLSSLPLPDYQAVRQVVTDLDVDFPGLAKSMAHLMVDPGLVAAGNSVSWAYNAFEYSMGRLLAPELDAPKFTDLDSGRREAFTRWNGLNELDEHIWSSCEPEVREKFTSEVKEWTPL